MPSLYVHVPFCIRKCDYCAFYSVPLQRNEVEWYLKSLDTEIDLRRQEVQGEISTLFVGGGTPTALREEELSVLLDTLNKNFLFAEAAEKTMEANPGTLNSAKLHVLQKQGINRISLGVQSFSDPLLKQIGRIHSSKDIGESVRRIRKSGFKNLNLDLMFGLPGQNLKNWQTTLQEVLRIQPEHLSVYGLMLEEGTPLAENENRLVDLPDDDAQAEMYEVGREILGRAGYLHYETSNYALPGYECQHNLGYWQGIDYLGIGPAAVSCLKNRRWKNSQDIGLYKTLLMQGVLPVDPEEDEQLSKREKRVERVILGLRLARGLDLKAFQREFGEDLFELYPEVLERNLKIGVLQLEEGYVLRINPNYWFVANSVLQEFV